MAIPFNPLNSPNNKEVVEHRLEPLGKRFKRDPVPYEQYCYSMEEVFREGCAHAVPQEELKGPKGMVFATSPNEICNKTGQSPHSL